jgi:NitT/TauT family transport system permease protein
MSIPKLGLTAAEVERPPLAPAAPPADAEGGQPKTSMWRIRQPLPRRVYASLAAAGFITAFLAWWLTSLSGHFDPVFVPSPEVVARTAVALLTDSTLWHDVGASFLRVVIGFVISAVIAIPIGLFAGTFRPVEALFQPFTEFVRYIPVPALIPILTVFFGIGETPKWMLIFVGTYFQLVLMVADEVRRIPLPLVQVAQTLGATSYEIVHRVLWRAAMPGIFDALRLCHGWAWTYVVVAELVAANEGLGFRILKFSRFLQTPKIWVYLILLGVIGLALDIAFRRLNARLFHWADTTKR